MSRWALVAAAGLFAVGCSGSDPAATAGSAAPGTAASPAEPTADSAVGDSAVGSADTVATTDAVTSDPIVTVLPSTPIPGGAPPPAGAGGEPLGPLGATDIDIDTDAGTVQIGDASVPVGLDPGFPLPGDLDVQLASETATDLGFSGTTELTLDELIAFYATSLTRSGYEITDTQVVEGVLAVYSFTGRDTVGQIAISETPGAASSTILVTIGDGIGQDGSAPG